MGYISYNYKYWTVIWTISCKKRGRKHRIYESGGVTNLEETPQQKPCNGVCVSPNKVTIMQNGHSYTDINRPILPEHRAFRVSTNTADCFSICSSVFCVINSELTVLSERLTPPPRSTSDKYYTSQGGKVFWGVLFFFMPAHVRSHTEHFVAGCFC